MLVFRFIFLSLPLIYGRLIWAFLPINPLVLSIIKWLAVKLAIFLYTFICIVLTSLYLCSCFALIWGRNNSYQ